MRRGRRETSLIGSGQRNGPDVALPFARHSFPRYDVPLVLNSWIALPARVILKYSHFVDPRTAWFGDIPVAVADLPRQVSKLLILFSALFGSALFRCVPKRVSDVVILGLSIEISFSFQILVVDLVSFLGDLPAVRGRARCRRRIASELRHAIVIFPPINIGRRCSLSPCKGDPSRGPCQEDSAQQRSQRSILGVYSDCFATASGWLRLRGEPSGCPHPWKGSRCAGRPRRGAGLGSGHERPQPDPSA